MIVPASIKEIRREKKNFGKLERLMKQHPDLPVVPMVKDGVYVVDGEPELYQGDLGDSFIASVCIANDRIVIWESSDCCDIDKVFTECGLDYEDYGITDGMPAKEQDMKMSAALQQLNWLICITSIIDVPSKIIPDNTEKQPEVKPAKKARKRK